MHSQTHCHPILHYQTCLPNLALTPRAYLFLHTLSGLLPMYSQAHCLCSLRLTAYVVSGSLPMYSQAHRLCILRFTAYLFSGSPPMYSQVHCLSILRLRLTAYGSQVSCLVFSGTVCYRLTAIWYSQAHCLSILRLICLCIFRLMPTILRLTAYVFSGSLPYILRLTCLCISIQAHWLTAYVVSGFM